VRRPSHLRSRKRNIKSNIITVGIRLSHAQTCVCYGAAGLCGPACRLAEAATRRRTCQQRHELTTPGELGRVKIATGNKAQEDPIMPLCEFNMPQNLDRALQIAASRPDIHTACLVSNRSHKNTPKNTKLKKVCLRIAQRLTSWPGNRLRKCNIFGWSSLATKTSWQKHTVKRTNIPIRWSQDLRTTSFDGDITTVFSHTFWTNVQPQTAATSTEPIAPLGRCSDERPYVLGIVSNYKAWATS
jgi:hypothetical protein